MTVFEEDTIAAISTALSEGGIGIVRISGPCAISTADRVYLSPGGKKKLSDSLSHQIHYGYISPDGSEENIIDEVLVSVMKGPRSYTGEDTVEINCHGGILAVRRVLDAVIDNGARLATPGEFTRRAFLNGRIDLSEAEAVMDIIEADNDAALKNSLRQLKGSVSNCVRRLRSEILHQTAHIEAALDDPEHYDFSDYIPDLEKSVCSWIFELSKLIESFENGRIIKDGIKTVIVGKPNAGKSSLLNLLLGEERAIVTQIPGTTRDLLTERINLDGISLLITDTAGIRDTEDPVEKIGVNRARKMVEDADLIICVTDSSAPLTAEDREVLAMSSGKRVIILYNKTDLPMQTSMDDLKMMIDGHDYKNETEIIPFSVLGREGYDRLLEKIKELFYDGSIRNGDDPVISNLRHKKALEKAMASLKMVDMSIKDGMSEDFYSIDLMNAYDSLGEITGDKVGEDLVNEIFSSFCMGK